MRQMGVDRSQGRYRGVDNPEGAVSRQYADRMRRPSQGDTTE